MKKQYVNGYKTKMAKGEKTVMAILAGVCVAAFFITFFTVTVFKKYSSVNNINELENPKEDIREIESGQDEIISKEDEEISTVSPDGTEEKENLDDNADVISFCAPLTGKIIGEYSPKIPLYSKTLDDWRVHPAIDIGVPLGCNVVSVSDGTVEEVKEDFKYGYTIVINHGNELRSIYSNLAGLETVQKGEEIKKGQTIAKVGDSALFETVADTHLHFEMTLKGENVNPLDYFDLK